MAAHPEYQAIFDALEMRGILYSLLRDEIDTGEIVDDLDLLVESRRFPETINALEDLGFHTKTTSRLLPYKSVLVKWTQRRFVVIDLHGQICQDEIVLMKSDPVLRETDRSRGYRMPTDADLLTILVLHNLVGKKAIQQKHYAVIGSLYDRVGDSALHDRLQELCPETVSDIVLDVVANRDRYREGSSESLAIREALVKAYRQADPELRRRERIRKRRLFMRRWSLRTRAPLYALTGVDGVGKSSLVDELLRMLNQSGGFRAVTEYMGPWGHHRLESTKGELFDPNWSITTRQWLQDMTTKRPDGQSPGLRTTIEIAAKNAFGKISTEEDKRRRDLVRENSRLYSTLRYLRSVFSATRYLITITVEMYYRYYLVYRHRRRGVTVIADRYIYDLMTGRMHEYTAAYSRIRSFLCWLYPKPTRVFLLTNDPDEILSRKDDLSEPALLKFLAIYEGLADRYRFDTIKTDRPAAQLADETVADHLPEIAALVRR